MEGNDLLLNLAVCLAAALFCGWLATRLRFSPMVGYLLAGIICGPFTPGFVASPKIADQLAEIGLVLLMFGVGLHFNFRELLAVRRIAVPGAVIQSLVTTLVVMGGSHLVGLSWCQGVIIGLAFSVASTAVLARMLSEHRVLQTPGGKLTMGWLVVEDIFTVVVLITLPLVAAHQGTTANWSSMAGAIGMGMAKMAALVVVIGLLGLRFVPWLLNQAVRSREMFNLAIPVLALGIAWISSEFFGVSLALGSFLAGVAAGQSRLLERIEETVLPVRDLFAALFFLSIGTLVNPQFVLDHPGRLLLSLVAILLIKPLTALVLVILFSQGLRTALLVAVGLAQVGEFSFILIRLGHELKLLPNDVGDQLIAAAMISIMVNPFLFNRLPRLEYHLRKLPWVRNREQRSGK